MRFHLDSANLDEIREGLTLGIEGVTTNPTLMAKATENVEFAVRVSEICGIVLGDVSVQTTYETRDEMYAEGTALHDINNHVVVKVPATEQGIIACRWLSEDRIRVNVTLVFSPMQALLAARAGAYIVSPFVARSNDAGGPGAGYTLISQTRRIFDLHKIDTKILAASLRSPEDVHDAAMAGADIATVCLPLLRCLHFHEKTAEGLAKMMADWNAAQKPILGGVFDHAPGCRAPDYGECTCAWDTQTR